MPRAPRFDLPAIKVTKRNVPAGLNKVSVRELELIANGPITHVSLFVDEDKFRLCPITNPKFRGTFALTSRGAKAGALVSVATALQDEGISGHYTGAIVNGALEFKRCDQVEEESHDAGNS